MTLENIERQLFLYSDDYNMENAVQKVKDAIEDAGLEVGNIICLFTYKRDNYLEISPFTCPSAKIENIKFDKK